MANPIAHEVGMLLGDGGEVVGEVPVDDNEEEPAMETVQTREAGCDASRRTLDGASGLAARSVKTSRLVQSRRWRVGHDSRLEGAGRCGVGTGEFMSATRFYSYRLVGPPSAEVCRTATIFP